MTYGIFETSQEDGQPIELYKFTHNNAIHAFTSADVDIVFDGITFKTGVSAARGEISQDIEDGSGRVNISISNKSSIAKLYIEYQPTTQILVQIYRFHMTDVAQDAVEIFRGNVLTCNFDGVEATLLCVPVTQGLNRVFPIHSFQSTCSHVVFSQDSTSPDGTTYYHKCNANPNLYKLEVGVDAISGSSITVSECAAKPDQYYQFGTVKISSGEVRMILSHLGSSLMLEHRITNLEVGDIVEILPGCDGQESTCRNKFSNIQNYLGFSRIPFKNPFTGEFT